MARTPKESQKVKELRERLERDHFWEEKHDSASLVAEIEKMRAPKRGYEPELQVGADEPDLQIGDRNSQQTLSSAKQRGYESDLQIDTDTENSGVDYKA